jgi:hypothetical protein
MMERPPGRQGERFDRPTPISRGAGASRMPNGDVQRGGLFRIEYEGRTLRENLGLPRPENSWAARPSS